MTLFEHLKFAFAAWRLKRAQAARRRRVLLEHRPEQFSHLRPYRDARHGMTGFTLIELMIVVGIIAILGAIAIPAYQDYSVRAKASEGLSLAASAQTAVNEGFQSGGLAGVTTAATGWTFTPTKYVVCVAIDDGAGAAVAGQCATDGGIAGQPGMITVYLDQSATGIPQLGTLNQLTLTPSVLKAALSDATPGNVDWACASAAAQTATTEGLPFTIASNGLLTKYAPQQCK